MPLYLYGTGLNYGEGGREVTKGLRGGFYPYKKKEAGGGGGMETVLAMLKGRH